MARRYQRERVAPPQSADFSEAQTQGQLTQTLLQFRRVVDVAGRRLGETMAERDEAGVSSPPKLKSNFTVFGRAYNNAALRNYAISVNTDIERELGRLEGEAAGDPDKFEALADGVRKGILKEAPGAARGDITLLFNRRMSEGVVRLDAQRREQQQQLNRGMLEQGLEVITDGISRKYASGDPTLMAQAEEDELTYNLMIDGATNDGTITRVEAVAMKNDGRKRITSQVIVGQFEREIQSGDPIGFMERLMNQPVENLADDEKQQLIGELFTRLGRRNSLVNMAEQNEVDVLKARYDAGEKYATLQLLEGKLNAERIAKLVREDYLDPSVARTLNNELQSGGQPKDDPRERFHVETNLLELSEDEITRNPRLTWDTRRQLIEKRRDLEGSWRSSQQAREGAERIDRALGIVPGTPTAFLSEEDLRARDQALTEWYEVVDALPPEERQLKSIELSQQVIQRVIRGNASKEVTMLENRLRQYTSDKDPTKLKGAALKEYQDTVARYERQIDAARKRATP